MHAAFTTEAAAPIKVHAFTRQSWTSAALEGPLSAFAETQGFVGGKGQVVTLHDGDGKPRDILFGLGDGQDCLAFAALSARLPKGTYKVETVPDDWPEAWTAAGWADGAYQFDRYRKFIEAPPHLALSTEGTAADEASALSREADAVALLRDLVNTPAADMGPTGLQSAVSALGETYGATVEVTIGEALLDANYPMVHAVGRAAHEAPRFIELSWGRKDAPELAIVGKGVAFDSGGLNIKTGDFMRIMKKDMGGAAHAIALAKLVMDAELDVHLKLYVPAVENAISANSFRPGDVLNTRKGLKVEIDNTDAEGRLILCDALARAEDSDPDLILDFATLTGAARVALGPDLAPFYTRDPALADAMRAASETTGEPVWEMPLWMPYRDMLSSSVADLCNSGGRQAGSITAAVYLAHFVERERWMHFDIWAWREAKYGRPAGGAATGLRAVWSMLQTRYAKSA
ncbi:MAG: leucyl aminopeptidase family protein [Pseudomonadota bacterium]